ncbi:MAG: ATP-binding protein [Pseudomonadota bacterium]
MRLARPSLRLILIAVNVLVLTLPLAGIGVLRLYESALVRQTESELIAQGAFVAAAYRNAFHRALGETRDAELAQHSVDVKTNSDAGLRYRPPVLDLVESRRLPPQPDPEPLRPGTRADDLAYVIGQDIEAVLADAQRTTLAAIRVVDYQGIIVASTGDDRYRHLLATEEVRLALDGVATSRLREKAERPEQHALDAISRTNRLRAFVATPVIDDGRLLGAVLLSRTPANIVQALYAKRALLTRAALLLLAVVVFIALLTSRTIVRPLGRLTDLARRTARGDSSAIEAIDSGVGGSAEISELGAQIADMGRTLDQRRRYVEEFARHVSHEFKTPLTALRGAIEVIEDHGGDMSGDELAGFLGNMSEDVAHLQKLTERLLVLAKADMARPRAAPTIELPAFIDALVARRNDPRIRAALPANDQAPGFAAPVDDTVLTAAIEQLIDNALQHGGEVNRICVSVERDLSHARIRVADDGTGISAGNAGKVLTPFFSTARESGGTGLGLTIAERLLRNQQCELRLLPSGASELGGASFEVVLPLIPAR